MIRWPIPRLALGGAWGLLLFAPWLSSSICYGGEGKDGAARPPVCALVDSTGLPAIALLEARLLANSKATWVERSQVEGILKEQQLQAAFGATGVKERLALGQLLKADILILLRAMDSPDASGAKLVQCVVCETTQGLRLRVASTPAGGDVEQQAIDLEAIALAGLQKHGEQITSLVAVPPLVSDNLGFEYNYLQTAYAKLVEETLLQVSGLVVVELGEAQQIATELLRSGSDPALAQRRAPLYVLGRFRHSGRGDEQTVAVRLRLTRGDEEIARYEDRKLKPAAAPAWMSQQTEALLTEIKAAPPQHASPAAQAQHLAARAKEFQRIGNWEEALALFEAALLLDPDQNDLRKEAAITAGRWFRQNDKNDWTADQLAAWFPCYLRGLEHVERYVSRAGLKWGDWTHEGRSFIDVFEFDFMRLIAPIQHQELPTSFFAPLHKHRTDTYLRIARSRAKSTFGEERWVYRTTEYLSEEKRLAIVLQLAEEFQYLPDAGERIWRMAMRDYARENSPAFRSFVQKLSELPSPAVAKVVVRLKAQFEIVPTSPSLPAPHEPPAETGKERAFLPVSLAAYDPQYRTSRPLHVRGCIPTEGELDIIWGHGSANTSIYVMDRPGHLEELWTVAELSWRIESVVYDGRLVWVAGIRPGNAALLVAVDPRTKETWKFAPEDGLPTGRKTEPSVKTLVDESVRAAPLSPGKVFLAGNLGRVWLGTASVSKDGKKTIRVFHEAREAETEQDKAAVEKTTASFQLGYLFAVPSLKEGGQTRVIVGRDSNRGSTVLEKPLIVNPETDQVEVAQFPLFHRQPSHIGYGEGSIFYNAYAESLIPLHRATFPFEKSEVFIADAPQGFLLVTSEGLQILGKKWWSADPVTAKVRVVNSAPPWHWTTAGNPNPDGKLNEVEAIFPSRHYGLLLILKAPNRAEQTILCPEPAKK